MTSRLLLTVLLLLVVGASRASATTTIALGSSSSGVGDGVNIVATLTSTVPVGSTTNLITYNTEAFDLNLLDCFVNPNLPSPKVLIPSVVFTGPTTKTVQIAVLAPVVGGQPIPDGVLYTCTLTVRDGTVPKTYTLTNTNTFAKDLNGVLISGVTGTDGTITVTPFDPQRVEGPVFVSDPIANGPHNLANDWVWVVAAGAAPSGVEQLAWHLWVSSGSTGSVRCTIWPNATSSLVLNPLAVGVEAKILLGPDTCTSVQAGDRLVLELGFYDTDGTNSVTFYTGGSDSTLLGQGGYPLAGDGKPGWVGLPASITFEGTPTPTASPGGTPTPGAPNQQLFATITKTPSPTRTVAPTNTGTPTKTPGPVCAGAVAVAGPDISCRYADETSTSCVASVGAPYCGGSNVAEPPTGISWFSPSNTCNNLDCSNFPQTTALSGEPGINTSQYAVFAQFNLAIPAGAPILGVRVRYERGSFGAVGNPVKTDAVKLVVDGSVVGTAKDGDVSWCSANSQVPCEESILGDYSDLWGTSPTWDQVQAAGFGFAVRVREPDQGTQKAIIGCARVEVCYDNTVSTFTPTATRTPTTTAAATATPTDTPTPTVTATGTVTRTPARMMLCSVGGSADLRDNLWTNLGPFESHLQPAPSKNEFTLETWVRWEGDDTDKPWVARWDTSGQKQYLLRVADTPGLIECCINTDVNADAPFGTQFCVVSDPDNPLNDDVCHHVACRYNRNPTTGSGPTNTLTLFIDGNKVATNTDARGNLVDTTQSTRVFCYSDGTTGCPTEEHRMCVEDVALYDFALPEERIQRHVLGCNGCNPTPTPTTTPTGYVPTMTPTRRPGDDPKIL